MTVALLPFAVACGRCGHLLAYEEPPEPPDFAALVGCPRCGWRGSITLPQLDVVLIEPESGA